MRRNVQQKHSDAFSDVYSKSIFYLAITMRDGVENLTCRSLRRFHSFLWIENYLKMYAELCTILQTTL